MCSSALVQLYGTTCAPTHPEVEAVVGWDVRWDIVAPSAVPRVPDMHRTVWIRMMGLIKRCIWED